MHNSANLVDGICIISSVCGSSSTYVSYQGKKHFIVCRSPQSSPVICPTLHLRSSKVRSKRALLAFGRFLKSVDHCYNKLFIVR
ncbi:DEHA2G20658p [Debaryomyces hansenii CBS767]|uniref:DEHA2G20658p n=1 Tax=Debaryomyces hansenii (strain ATCC 36239 / CBS 767 / BCRC 21394 / JCM 1990 / NBRC 0083 / IGC 2968) TaxID=284592 RepID=Q6BH81_DEBHA|nr:DEHA2G20658p [Debaryomyces hansenii CBS767]CAG90950.2 DEHA2G20658p [Debaryomyces hansenii CBS767]|eukprot:XP_462440.2 DEHA2G20658p [Debaryomyces hansenii CBS767]